jgi:hypothetical protein
MASNAASSGPPPDSAAHSGAKLSDALFRRKPKGSSSSSKKAKSSSKKSKASGSDQAAVEASQPPDASDEQVLDDLLEQLDVNSDPQVVQDVVGSLASESSAASLDKSVSSGGTGNGSATLWDKMDDVKEKFWAANNARKSRQQARKVCLVKTFVCVGSADEHNQERKKAELEASRAQAQSELDGMPQSNEADEEKKGIDKKCLDLGVYVVEMTPDGHWCVPAPSLCRSRVLDGARQSIRSNSGSGHATTAWHKCTFTLRPRNFHCRN